VPPTAHPGVATELVPPIAQSEAATIPAEGRVVESRLALIVAMREVIAWVIGKFQMVLVPEVRTHSAAEAPAPVGVRHVPPVREGPPASEAAEAGAPAAAAVAAVAGGK
jgi:hypothetical protein